MVRMVLTATSAVQLCIRFMTCSRRWLWCHCRVGPVPMKKSRAKKPAGAPTRPRSPYMFFLADFREQFKKVRLVPILSR